MGRYFEVHSDLLSIDRNLKRTALRDFATGRTAIAYRPFSTRLLDPCNKIEDLPAVASGSFEAQGATTYLVGSSNILVSNGHVKYNARIETFSISRSLSLPETAKPMA